jgi:hypothetical protein
MLTWRRAEHVQGVGGPKRLMKSSTAVSPSGLSSLASLTGFHAPTPLVRALYLVHTVCQRLHLVGPLDRDAGEERHKEIEKQ